jgi:hypothetical protein
MNSSFKGRLHNSFFHVAAEKWRFWCRKKIILMISGSDYLPPSGNRVGLIGGAGKDTIVLIIQDEI